MLKYNIYQFRRTDLPISKKILTLNTHPTLVMYVHDREKSKTL